MAHGPNPIICDLWASATVVGNNARGALISLLLMQKSQMGGCAWGGELILLLGLEAYPHSSRGELMLFIQQLWWRPGVFPSDSGSRRITQQGG